MTALQGRKHHRFKNALPLFFLSDSIATATMNCLDLTLFMLDRRLKPWILEVNISPR